MSSDQSTVRRAKGHVVGVADLVLASQAGEVITTYALGSCIGITVYDPVAKVGGMLHFMLPQPPAQARSKADENPHMYASTGIPLLFRKVYELGAQKERIIVCAAGAAEVISHGKMFAIGQRNRTMMRKIFWKNGVAIAAEDTGGTVARTMVLDTETGIVRIKEKSEAKILWQP